MSKYPILAAWLVYWLCHSYSVEANVICDETKMTVAIEKSSYPRLSLNHLRLSNPTNGACSVRSNSTHIYSVVPLNECGTQIEENDENLIFKNEITIEDNTGDLITRKCLFELKFYCQYPKRGNVTLGFSVHRKSVTVTQSGFGTFTYKFEFYSNKNFKSPIELPSYILECTIGTRIYMQIEATSSFKDAKLFVESCKAAPVDNPNYEQTYSIIDNGCNVDPTFEIHPAAHDRQFRFSMEAFKFIGLYDQVYVTCSVMICEAQRSDTRCAKGCINSRSWPSDQPHQRGKREAAPVTQSLRHNISQGPLRLKRSAESSVNPGINLNLNLVFIAGCLLAAVGMISAAIVYKAKLSSVRYQPLPKYES
ncbi:ZP domain-containing protein-like isoform X1 [Epinephelus moara]|uniref:ZP domain-containing protein-like isoform X1 n=2 Tax=Epinephelus moara TaxID=300413 RepID=UPI00214EDD16|nr:ZP domain-containing protein-like isoform X1 [Epinephelus moara]